MGIDAHVNSGFMSLATLQSLIRQSQGLRLFWGGGTIFSCALKVSACQGGAASVPASRFLYSIRMPPLLPV